MPLEETQSHNRETPAYQPEPGRKLGLVLPSFHDGLVELLGFNRHSSLPDDRLASVIGNYVEAYFRLVLVGDHAAEKVVVETRVAALDTPPVPKLGSAER